uniref:Lipocalin domain-containing protein n=2 Tax=Onchocerca TaxID=6281 RepID=A0A8R1XVQ9_ONCVO
MSQMAASSLGRSSTIGTIFILTFSFFSWINLPLSHSQLIVNDTQQQQSLAKNVISLPPKSPSKLPQESKQNNPALQSAGKTITLTKQDKIALAKLSEIANGVLGQLGFSSDLNGRRYKPLSPFSSLQSDDINSLLSEANQNRIDLQGIASGQIPGLAPIPVPAFPGPQDVPAIPGVNTIPGLSNFNYLISQLFPQMIPPTNTLLGSSISRLVPKGYAKNLAKDVFRAVHPAAENVDVARMMGRWFQVINSPHVIREACTVSHFGALTNNTYSATFTILKFYREGNANGPPRFSLGYGFKSGDTGQFVLHSSNSPDSEPFWVIKKGPLNEYNQYDYVIVSNWVRFPVFVIARDPEQFRNKHMRNVLQFLEDNNYINVVTKAFNMISPVDYSQCQYTPTFSGAGR